MIHLRTLTVVGLALIAIEFAAADEPPLALVLSGEWSGSAPDGTGVSYSFSRDGTVVWHVDEENFKSIFPNGLKGKYQARFGKPYWEIDIFEFDDPRFKPIRFQGILEIIDRSTVKMEGMPSNRGDRPKEFGKEAITLHRSGKPDQR